MTHKIDTTKGERIGTVNAQWASRPDDQKFLDLTSLRAQVAAWADASFTEDVKPAEIMVAPKDGGLELGYGGRKLERVAGDLLGKVTA